MTQIEQIKAELQKRLLKYDPDMTNAGRELQEVLAFIDSLPAETASPKPEKQNTKEGYCYQCKWYVKNIRFGDDCPYWKNMINPIKCEHFKHKNTAI